MYRCILPFALVNLVKLVLATGRGSLVKVGEVIDDENVRLVQLVSVSRLDSSIRLCLLSKLQEEVAERERERGERGGRGEGQGGERRGRT